MPFHAAVKDWYWGHASLRPYKPVWLNSNNHQGKTFNNVYISRSDGDAHASCANNLEGVMPNMVNIEIFDECYEITFTLSGAEMLKVRVEQTKVIGSRGLFVRYTGKTSVTIDGSKLEGTALFQEFHS